MPDHSTPEGRRCPECEKPLAIVPGAWECVNPECARFGDMWRRTVPTPAPVGGEAVGVPRQTCLNCGKERLSGDWLTDSDDELEDLCMCPATPTSAEGGEAYFVARFDPELRQMVFEPPTLAATGGEEAERAATVERGLAMVAEFNGDGRCGLNCMYSEALAGEVLRLRRQLAEAGNRLGKTVTQAGSEVRHWCERATTAERRLEELTELHRVASTDGEVFERALTASQQEVARLRNLARRVLDTASSPLSSEHVAAKEVLSAALSSSHQSTGLGA